MPASVARSTVLAVTRLPKRWPTRPARRMPASRQTSRLSRRSSSAVSSGCFSSPPPAMPSGATTTLSRRLVSSAIPPSPIPGAGRSLWPRPSTAIDSTVTAAVATRSTAGSWPDVITVRFSIVTNALRVTWIPRPLANSRVRRP